MKLELRVIDQENDSEENFESFIIGFKQLIEKHKLQKDVIFRLEKEGDIFGLQTESFAMHGFEEIVREEMIAMENRTEEKYFRSFRDVDLDGELSVEFIEGFLGANFSEQLEELAMKAWIGSTEEDSGSTNTDETPPDLSNSKLPHVSQIEDSGPTIIAIPTSDKEI